MKRVIVIGGSGFFGGLIVARLRAAGLEPIAASRTQGDLRIDVDRPEDLRANLQPRDLIVDAAGPFHKRTPALIDAARTIGFDVIDLSDSPEYTSLVYEREAPINAAGIRVLTSCSALSTLSAAVLKSTPVEHPRRLSVYLVPASRYTASPGTITAVLSSLLPASRTFQFPRPFGRRTGIGVKSVDSVTLPRLFPTLRTTDLYVDTQVPGMNLLLQAARWPAVRRIIERHQRTILGMARRFGRSSGMIAFEIASQSAHKRYIFAGEKSYLVAVIPAVETAIAIANGRMKARGLVPPTEQIDAAYLLEAIRKERITLIAG